MLGAPRVQTPSLNSTVRPSILSATSGVLPPPRVLLASKGTGSAVRREDMIAANVDLPLPFSAYRQVTRARFAALPTSCRRPTPLIRMIAWITQPPQDRHCH